MPKMFLPLGKMNLERGSIDGDHAWVIKDLLPTAHGYESAPRLTAVATVSSTSSNPKGGINWRGRGTARMYVGTSGKIYEVASTTFTDVSRSTTYTNGTYGPTFAAYGNRCYHSNGIDRINSIVVPETTGQAANFGDITYTSGGAVIAPRFICSHKNHLVGANIKMLEGYGEIDSVSQDGLATPFTQPATQRIEAVSSDVADITPLFVTIWGAMTGTDTVTVETLVLTGTTAVPTAATTWGKVLGFATSGATIGTVTLRIFGGGATITSLPPSGAASSIGVLGTSLSAGDSYVDLVADAATTKRIGLLGTDQNGVQVYDSQDLNGTTHVQSNSRFRTVTAIFYGDLETTPMTVTVSTHQFAGSEQYEYLVWISGTDLPEGYGDPQVAPQITGSDYRYLFDGIGTITGSIDGGDCFFVFKSGSIIRFDGPPFQPTVINYNIGMRPGNTPFRQGERVYFWSSKGLSYIDIRSNEVVHVFEDSMQRSVLDAGSYLTNEATIGLFPEQNISTISGSIASAASSTARVSIAGDPEYNLIFVTYYSGSPSYGSTDSALLCYHERLDSFSLLNGPVGTEFTGLILDYNNDAASSFPGSAIRIFRETAATTVLTMYAFTDGGLIDLTGAQCPYIRFPFKSVDPQSSRSRITKVRPVFDNAAYIDRTVTMAGTRIEILSISGTARSWTFDSVLTVGTGTYSVDGWYEVSNCPYADKHSIGVHFQATSPPLTPPEGMWIVGLVGVEIEFVLEQSRTL